MKIAVQNAFHRLAGRGCLRDQRIPGSNRGRDRCVRTPSHVAAGFCCHVSHLHCLLLQLPANALGHVLQHPDAARDQLQLLILLLHNQLGPKRRETGNYRSAACSWVGASPSSGQARAARPTSAVRPGLRPKPAGMRTAFLRNAGEVTTRGKPP